MDATQPTTAQLVEAIEAGLDPDYVRAGKPRVEAGREAFRVYRQHYEALEAENAKLREFVDRVGGTFNPMRMDTPYNGSNPVGTLASYVEQARELLAELSEVK